MNRRIWGLYAALAVLTGAALAADKGALEIDVNGTEIVKNSESPKESPDTPTRERCMSQCGSAETKCSLEVRRARQECSKNAASAGRDPFTMRNDNYSYFCSYFHDPERRCGSDRYSQGCQARLANRYGLCVDAMYNNIAVMRYDCFRSEREAQNFCREELRDCKSACQ